MPNGNNIAPEELDDLVHQAASELATNANNGGASEQIAFLTTTCGWTFQEIENSLGKPVTIERYP